MLPLRSAEGSAGSKSSLPSRENMRQLLTTVGMPPLASTLNVFNCTDGAVRHSFAPELQHMPVDPGQSPRHVDSIWPMWNLFDFTPDGRGKDHPKLQYAASPPT